MANYWTQREQDYQKDLDRQDLKTAQKLQQVHEQSYNDIKAKLQETITKYSTDTGLSLSEAKEVLKTYKVDSATEAKIQEYVANKDFSPAANKFLKEYNFVTRASGLELLRNNIGVNLIELGVKREDIIKDSLTTAQIQELTTTKGIMAAMPGTGKPVESTINASYHGATWSDRIWSHMDGLRAKLDTEMRKALTLGTGYPMPAALKKEFGVTTNEAKRLAYTEMTRVRVDARLQRFKNNGVTKYKYNAIVDTKTSDVCLGLNGMLFDLEEGVAGVNLPPMHPYCRSSIVPVRDKLDESVAETPEESLAFAEKMLKLNPDSQLWKSAAAYHKKADDGLMTLEESIALVTKSHKLYSVNKDTFNKELTTILSNVSPKLSTFYAKFAKKFIKKNLYDTLVPTAYYKPSENKVYMNMNENSRENKLKSGRDLSWHVKFHEEFHQIDYAATRGTPSNQIKKALDEDLKNYTGSKKLSSMTKEELTALRQKLRSDIPNNVVGAMLTDALGCNSLGTIPVQAWGFYGHRPDYTSTNENAGYEETWATFGSILFTGTEEEVEFVKKHMPKTWEKSQEVLDDIISKFK